MKRNKIKTINISWSKFGKLVKKLGDQIEEWINIKPHYKNIYAVPRGGYPISVYLSHRFNLPIITNSNKISRSTLIVDDINDTGETLRSIIEFKPHLSDIATLYSTTWTSIFSDFNVKTKHNQNEWIVFPWENEIKEVKKHSKDNTFSKQPKNKRKKSSTKSK